MSEQIHEVFKKRFMGNTSLKCSWLNIRRSDLNNVISLKDFQNFYWLKTELVSFCRANGISAAGGKIEITARIELFLATGKIVRTAGKPIPTSRFSSGFLNLSQTN